MKFIFGFEWKKKLLLRNKKYLKIDFKKFQINWKNSVIDIMDSVYHSH